MTKPEAAALISDVVNKIRREADLSDGEIAELFSTYNDAYDVFAALYEPDEKVMAVITEYQQWCVELADAKAKREKKRIKELNSRAGTLMEELAFLVFSCLQGKEFIKSFQSYAAQHDLIISGSRSAWNILIEKLHLPATSQTLVIEAKNTQKPVTDSQFSRLCSIVQNKLDATCSLGVFYPVLARLAFPRVDRLDGKDR